MQHGDSVDDEQPGLQQRVQCERHDTAATRQKEGVALEWDVEGQGGPDGADTKWRPRPAVAMAANGWLWGERGPLRSLSESWSH